MFFGGGGRCDVLGGLLLGILGVSLPLPGRGALPVESIFYTRVTFYCGESVVECFFLRTTICYLNGAACASLVVGSRR